MTEWHGVGALQEAIERTKKLLLPFRLGFWLRLALVAMLLGGGGGGGGGGGDGGGDRGGYGSGSGFSSETVSPDILLAAPAQFAGGLPAWVMGGGVVLLAAIFAVLLAFILVMFYLRSVSVYVFIKALADGDLRLIEGYKSQARRGLSLFIFEFAVTIVLILVFVAAILAGVSLYESMSPGFMGIFLIIIAVFAFVAVILAAILFIWLVTELAAPVMYATGCGLLEAMGRVRELASNGFWQFAVYIVLRLGFGLVGSVVQFVVQLVFLLPVLAVIFVFGFGASAFGGSAEPLMPLVMLALLPVFLVIQYVTSFITLPVNVFLTYYSLIFLARMNPAYSVFAPQGKEPGMDESSGKVKVY